MWVEFKIGEYNDRFLCDVTEMDACHFLLGRPWQYDVCAKHDGKKNVYTITKDGVEYIMPPSPNDGNPITNGVMLVGEKEFMRLTKEKDTPCYALVVRPQKHPIKKSQDPPKVINVGPKEVRDLLEKYRGIFVGKQLETFPLEKDISHCIDFIPGATLPNKVAYKMSPE